jgi:hypothetical protein
MKALAAGLCILPGAAFACALPPSVILTLPTGHYITAAALTVALTAVLGAVAGRMPAMTAAVLWERQVLAPQTVTSYVSFLCFLGLLAIGGFGGRDPMHNLMTLVFWTGVWIAVPLASMLLGNVWRTINPWTGPVRIARVLLGRTGGIGLSRLGHWPAVCGYAGFVWFQMIYAAPDDPAILAGVAGLYWLVIFGLAVAEGEDWLDRGEFLTVLFGLIAKVAPFWLDRAGSRHRVMRGWPGAQVAEMAPLSFSAVVFVTLALAALSFDGLSQTFFWHGLIGDNPLEPAGRSAVALVNTLGLMGVWALTLGGCLGAFALGRWISPGGFATGPVMLSFLAIAAGYHAAHYVVMLLTTGQYTLAALNDPFFQGESWLGLPPFYVSFGFLTDPDVMPVIYAIQFAAVLGAHLLAVVLSLRLAGCAGTLAHLPLTVMMVGYTIFGLWILSTAKTG